MANYTKINDQSPFLANLEEGELVVLLNTGDKVAVRALGFVEPNTGNTVIHAAARAVNDDGSTRTDANNQPIQSGYTFSADSASVEAMGGVDGFRRNMLLTVLGEGVSWVNLPAQDVIDHASIRTNLNAAAHSGPATDIGSIL